MNTGVPLRARRWTTRAIATSPNTLNWAVRIAVILEILDAYWQTSRSLADHDLRDLMARRVRPPAPQAGVIDLDAGQARTVAIRLGHAVSRTLTPLPTDSRCLAQSLTLSRLLAARGIESQLVIGAHSKPDFEAHAWVEHDGVAVLPVRGFNAARLVEL